MLFRAGPLRPLNKSFDFNYGFVKRSLFTSSLNSSIKQKQEIKTNQVSVTRTLPKTNTCGSINLLRSFSTGLKAFNYYRPPKNTVVGGGILSRLWGQVPDSLKLLGLVGVSAYFIIFIAVPVLFMVVPPLLLGGWLFVRLNRYFRTKRMEKRWAMINKSSLVFHSHVSKRGLLGIHPEDMNDELVAFEMNRIIDSFWDNEQDIATYFKIDDINNLALGTLEAIEYNYETQNAIFLADKAETNILIVQSRVLFNKLNNKEIANVVMSLKSSINLDFNDDPLCGIKEGQMLIEIVPNSILSKAFVLDTSSATTRSEDGNGDENGDNDDYNDNGGSNNGGFKYNNDGEIIVKGKTKIL